jgi:hypothetical protein
MFFKNAVNCELALTVPNLLAMCELAIFYILYKRSVISLALTLAIVDVSNNKVVYRFCQKIKPTMYCISNFTNM